MRCTSRGILALLMLQALVFPPAFGEYKAPPGELIVDPPVQNHIPSAYEIASQIATKELQSLRSWSDGTYFGLLKRWQRVPQLSNVDCSLSVDGEGKASNIRINKPSGLVQNDDVLRDIVSDEFEKLRNSSSLWEDGEKKKTLVVQSGQFPKLKILELNDKKNVIIWPTTDEAHSLPSSSSNLDKCFSHLQYPLTEDPEPWEVVACRFTLTTEGQVKDLRIKRSSGLKPVDAAALAAVGGPIPPFENTNLHLERPQDIVVLFYQNGELRAKYARTSTLLGASNQPGSFHLVHNLYLPSECQRSHIRNSDQTRSQAEH